MKKEKNSSIQYPEEINTVRKNLEKSYKDQTLRYPNGLLKLHEAVLIKRLCFTTLPNRNMVNQRHNRQLHILASI